jgi:O-antigen ligase
MEKIYSVKSARENFGNVANFTIAFLSAIIFCLLGPIDFLFLSLALAILTVVLFKPFYGLCFLSVSIPYAGLLQIAPSFTVNKVFAFWVLLAFLLGILIKKENLGFFSSNTLKLYFVFLVYQIFTFPFHGITPDSIEALFSKTFLVGLIYLIAVIPQNYKEFKIFCVVSAAGSAFLGMYIALFGMGQMVGEYGTRLAVGTNENVLSHALAVGLLLSFFALKGSSKKLKYLILLLDMFSIYAILLTGSRGTWLALIFSIGLFPLFAPNIPFKKRMNYVLAGILVVSTVVLGLTYDLFGQWGHLVMNRLMEHDTVSAAAGGRMSYIWPFYLARFFEKPLLGWGLGPSEYLGLSAHNDYLFIMVETGLVGILLYLTFCAFALKDILANKDSTIRLQALILFSFLLIGGLTHNTVTLKSYALALGALCFLARMNGQQSKIQPKPRKRQI